MGLFEGKQGLIFGVANKNSIAWGIAQALHAEGAKLGFSYAGEILQKRVVPLAESVGSDFVEDCDLTDDDAIDNLFNKAQRHFGKLDFVVHSVAFVPREDLTCRFVDTSRNGFGIAMDVSAYTLIAIAKRAAPLMPDGGSIMAMTYYGSEKVTPGYNVMGVAKAALEASVRYLAWDLGKENIRVNAVSAGPIRTLAASAIGGIRKSIAYTGEVAPMGNVTQTNIGDAAKYLLGDWSTGVTGEVIHVDGGYNIMGAPDPEMMNEL